MSSVHRFIVDAIGGAGAEIVRNLGGGAAMSADLSMGSAETFYVYVRGNRAGPAGSMKLASGGRRGGRRQLLAMAGATGRGARAVLTA